MFKNPIIRFLLAINLLIFVCLAVVCIRNIVRNRHRQAMQKLSAAEFVKAAEDEDDRRGEFALEDSKRAHAIGSVMTDADVIWLLSLMDKTFPNGKPYGVTQGTLVNFRLLYYKGGFTLAQKKIIYEKCCRELNDQINGSQQPNPPVIETCCLLFDLTKDQRAVPFLRQLLNNPSSRVKTIAARTLTDLGHPTKVNIPNSGFGKQTSQ